MSGELPDFLRFCLILTERINESEHHDDRIFELLHSNLKYLISFWFNIVVKRFKIFELHRVSSIKAFPKYLFLYWKSDLAHPIADWNFDNASLLFFHREKLINQLLQDLQQQLYGVVSEKCQNISQFQQLCWAMRKFNCKLFLHKRSFWCLQQLFRSITTETSPESLPTDPLLSWKLKLIWNNWIQYIVELFDLCLLWTHPSLLKHKINLRSARGHRGKCPRFLSQIKERTTTVPWNERIHLNYCSCNSTTERNVINYYHLNNNILKSALSACCVVVFYSPPLCITIRRLQEKQSRKNGIKVMY